MAQFDVFKNARRGLFPLLFDVQADNLQSLATRIVVPMISLKKAEAPPISRINLRATIAGVEYLLLFNELAAVELEVLGERVDNLAQRRPEWIAALDLMFTGS